MRLVWLALSLGCAIGCADPFIESSTVLSDTTDAVGPYTVDTVVVGTSSGDRLEIRHNLTGQADSVIVMLEDNDDGDGRGERFRGEIPGQPAGSEIGYFIVLIRDETIVDRDPPGDGVMGPRFVFSVTP